MLPDRARTGICIMRLRSIAAYPKILRRVSGYNLDEFTDRSKPVNLAKLIVGSEGTLGIILELKVRLVPLPKAKAIMVIMFGDLLEALEAAPVILRHRSFGDRDHGQVHPRSRPRQPDSPAHPSQVSGGRSRSDAVRGILR